MASGAVMLTGATGFLGSHMAEALVREGVPTRLLVRRRTGLVNGLERQGAKVFSFSGSKDTGAIRSSLEGAGTVIHCAGAIRAVSWRAFHEANVGLTRRILSLTGPDQGFIYISSQAAAGPSPGGIPLDETSPPRPINDYGRSKRMAEDATEAWGRVNRRSVTILRPSAVYGPGEKDFYRLFKGIRRGVALLPGNGRQRLSLIHVDDLVRAVLASLECGSRGETYFVTGNETASWLELARHIQASFSRDRVLRLRCPAALAYPAALAADAMASFTGKPGLLCRDKVLEMRPPAWLCSNRKIQSDLSWSPRVSLAQGVARAAEWYMKVGWL